MSVVNNNAGADTPDETSRIARLHRDAAIGVGEGAPLAISLASSPNT